MSFLIKRNKVYHLCWYQGKKICPVCNGKKIVTGKPCKRCRGIGEVLILHKKRLAIDRQTSLDYKAEFDNKLRRNELGLQDTKKTWTSFIGEYLNYSKANKRPGTFYLDKFVLTNFSNLFRPSFIRNIGPHQIEQYKQERLNTISPTTVNIEFRTLKTAFSKAVEWKYLDVNPAKYVKQIKIPPKTPRFLSKKEIKKLLTSITNKTFRLIIKTFILTGFRLSELMNLRWEDINWKRKIITIQAHDDFQPKDYQIRTIPMHKDLFILFRPIKKNGGYIFTNVDGSRLKKRNLEKQFQKAIKKAGIHYCRIHDLRHTFASHLVMSGVDLTTVKEILGHSSYSTTLVYAHLSKPHLKGAIDRLNFNL